MTKEKVCCILCLEKQKHIHKNRNKGFHRRIHHLSKKNWERKECDGCKSYNPECRQGACSLYPYRTGYKPQKNLPLVETSDTS